MIFEPTLISFFIKLIIKSPSFWCVEIAQGRHGMEALGGLKHHIKQSSFYCHSLCCKSSRKDIELCPGLRLLIPLKIKAASKVQPNSTNCWLLLTVSKMEPTQFSRLTSEDHRWFVTDFFKPCSSWGCWIGFSRHWIDRSLRICCFCSFTCSSAYSKIWHFTPWSILLLRGESHRYLTWTSVKCNINLSPLYIRISWHTNRFFSPASMTHQQCNNSIFSDSKSLYPEFICEGLISLFFSHQFLKFVR